MYARAIVALGLNHRPVAGLFCMTVSVVVGLVVIYLSHALLGIPEWKGFGLGRDRSAPEVVGYVFAAWAAGLATYLAVSRRQAVLGAWSALFVVLLADDYFRLHERAAKVIAANFGIPHPYGQPAGEVAWFGTVGLVLLTAIAVGHRVAAPEWRAASRVLTVLLGLLVLCGVGIDAVHTLASSDNLGNVIFTALEDGGELLILAVAATYLYGLSFGGHQQPPDTLVRRRVGLAGMRHLSGTASQRRSAVRRSGTGPPTR